MELSVWDIISLSITGVVALLMLYQVVYIIIGLFAKLRYPDAKTDHTYGIIICGRNEQSVIGNLIDSIRKQNYPQDKLRIFVVADNCDAEDATAAIARDMGCDVFERFDLEHIGKSFALDFVFQQITENFADYQPDGYFIFDADNLLDVNYIREMNKCFDAGNKIITSYRNSKNFGKNIWSMGSSVHFVRECRFVHTARYRLGVSSHVSGTGFLVASDVLNISNGWKYRRLTEDIEFSIDQVVKNQKVSYCDTAIFYDEQPTTWPQTFRQRMRWQKGGYQVATGYTGKLLKKLFTSGKFACFDLGVYFCVSLLLTFWMIASFIVGNVMLALRVAPDGAAAVAIALAINISVNLGSYYVGLFIYGSLAVVKDWDRIHATSRQKIASMFAYPIFMFCLIPIVFLALFTKPKWKPIVHNEVVSIEDLCVAESVAATTEIAVADSNEADNVEATCIE